MPAKKHDFSTTEIKAGFMVVVSVVVIVGFISVLSGMRPPEEVKTYHTFFQDTGGLNRAADVRFGGVKVGKVLSIEPAEQDQARVRVDYTVAQNVPVNDDSFAFITQTTLTAEKHLEVTTGSTAAALLANDSEVPHRDTSLFGQLDDVSGGLVAVLDDVRALLGVEAQSQQSPEGEAEEMRTVADILGDVDTTVGEGESLLKDLRDTVNDSRDDLNEILAQIKGIEGSAKDLVDNLGGVITENRADIRTSIQSVNETTAQIAAVSQQLDSFATHLETTLTNAALLSGDAKSLVEDNRPVLDEILTNLRDTIRYLEAFSRTLAEQPEAVIRGKTPQGRR